MKCSRCGHRANSLSALGRHARKEHAAAVKAKAARSRAENKESPTRSKSRRSKSGDPLTSNVSALESGGTITITIRR